MRNFFLSPFIVSLICLLSTFAQAQTSSELCGSALVEQALDIQDPTLSVRSAEMDRLFKQTILSDRANASRSQDTLIYTIPLVFHILHQNSHGNIPASRVYTEINHLNDAFRNVGLYDPTIGEDVYVQFCLAQVAPDGTATSGINWYESPYTEITSGDDFDMKAQFNWDPNRYLNVYVVRGINFNGQAIAGYAYYPTSAGQFWDGIVVRQSVVGLSESESGTTVHEIGHYLGLPHPFSGGCANDDCFLQGDRVCDTPPDNSSVTFEGCAGGNNNCSTDADDPSPQNPFTSDVPDFSNLFMDYNIGTCRLAFSAGQVERMRTALRILRSDLINSTVCSIPKTFDAGIIEIEQPITTNCEAIFSPEVLLYNFGLVPINNVEIYYQVDNGPLYIANWSGSLFYTDSVRITLPPPGIVTSGQHDLRVYTVNPNGTADLFTANDTSSIRFNFQPSASLPIAVDFESGIPSEWSIFNPSGLSWQWSDYGCDPSGSTVNHSLLFDNTNFYAGGIDQDGFLSPRIDLTLATEADLSFDIAYGFDDNIGNPRERLIVEVSADCGETFLPANLYEKAGSSLATQSILLTDPGVWTPQDCEDWRTETLSLSAFLGQQIILRFTVDKDDNGFPIYLDNINITGNVSVGLEAESLGANIRVFPNPAREQLQVAVQLEEPAPVDIRLLDIRGKATAIGISYTNQVDAKHTLDISELPAGVYLLEVRSGDSVQIQKVIIW